MKREVIAEQKGSTLPEHAVGMDNWPQGLPQITDREVTGFLQARDFFQIARADYERRRAELLYKLLLECEPEDQHPAASYLLSLESDRDTIRIVDQSSIPAETIIDQR